MINSDWSQKQFIFKENLNCLEGGWRSVTPNTPQKIYHISDIDYHVDEKRIRYQECTLKRVAQLCVAIVTALITLGLAPLLSKFIQRLFSGKQILRILTPAQEPGAAENSAPEGAFLLTLNSREGNPKKISMPIAKCNHLALTAENLPEIFDLANRHTVHTPYPIEKYTRTMNGHTIHRINHNGTHSIRQVRYVEVLLNLLKKHGNAQALTLLDQCSEEIVLNTKLAAFFLRAGRVDETSHKMSQPDDYYTRSADLYVAYARQLGVDEQTIEWFQALIIDSCKPMNKCTEASKGGLSKFIYDLLSTVHEMDLVRCFKQAGVNRHKADTKKTLKNLLNQSGDEIEEHTNTLYDFATDLCERTGQHLNSQGKGFQPALFAKCSLDAKHCLRVVKEAQDPFENQSALCYNFP